MNSVFTLYLVIDHVKGFLEENNGNKYLTMIFSSESQKLMYTKIWEEIKKAINKVSDSYFALASTIHNKLDDYSKDYSVISLSLMTFCL